ncbi:MAG: hypothetical protein IJX16_04825 [Clostridia bacterium]|nr:hypothetical protein [Clostridia bacterium]
MGYFKKFKNDGVPFMENAEKGEINDLLGQKLHITDFGFINGKNGKFAVLQFGEKPNMFYFGNSIVSEMLEQVQIDGMEQELPNVEIMFEKRVSKETNREYTAFEIFE